MVAVYSGGGIDGPDMMPTMSRGEGEETAIQAGRWMMHLVWPVEVRARGGRWASGGQYRVGTGRRGILHYRYVQQALRRGRYATNYAPNISSTITYTLAMMMRANKMYPRIVSHKGDRYDFFLLGAAADDSNASPGEA